MSFWNLLVDIDASMMLRIHLDGGGIMNDMSIMMAAIKYINFI